jgi:protein-S-isoprenylcysteine O-methyltransferase Ste14
MPNSVNSSGRSKLVVGTLFVLLIAFNFWFDSKYNHPIGLVFDGIIVLVLGFALRRDWWRSHPDV